jgi:hypothetical protein
MVLSTRLLPARYSCCFVSIKESCCAFSLLLRSAESFWRAARMLLTISALSGLSSSMQNILLKLSDKSQEGSRQRTELLLPLSAKSMLLLGLSILPKGH